MEKIKLTLTKLKNGFWFGMAKNNETHEDLHDQHGNNIECMLNTPENCAKHLLKELRNNKIL